MSGWRLVRVELPDATRACEVEYDGGDEDYDEYDGCDGYEDYDEYDGCDGYEDDDRE